MSFRGAVVMAVVVGACALAWQQQDRLRAWMGSLPPPSLPTLPRGESSADAKNNPAGLRKCLKGTEVSYTNAACPPGSREQAVTAPPVNVLPATPVPKPAQAAQASSGPAALREALDIKREETLRDKAMERAVEGIR